MAATTVGVLGRSRGAHRQEAKNGRVHRQETVNRQGLQWGCWQVAGGGCLEVCKGMWTRAVGKEESGMGRLPPDEVTPCSECLNTPVAPDPLNGCTALPTNASGSPPVPIQARSGTASWTLFTRSQRSLSFSGTVEAPGARGAGSGKMTQRSRFLGGPAPSRHPRRCRHHLGQRLRRTQGSGVCAARPVRGFSRTR